MAYEMLIESTRNMESYGTSFPHLGLVPQSSELRAERLGMEGKCESQAFCVSAAGLLRRHNHSHRGR